MRAHVVWSSACLAAALLLLAPLFGLAQDQPTQPPDRFRLEEGGTVSFVTRGPQVTRPIKGRFGVVTSRLTFDPDDLSTARGVVEVVLTSVTSADSGWDAMFRRAPFLALDEHPRARFEVRGVRGPSQLVYDEWNPVRFVGDLSLHGETRDKPTRARLRYCPHGDRRNDKEKLQVRTTFDLTWLEFRINVPDGVTREFAGDGVRVTVDLAYRGH